MPGPRLILDQSPLPDRAHFGELLKDRGLLGQAVEVGTYRGEFAAKLLHGWPGRLICVDPWRPGYDPHDPASRSDMEEAYLQTLLALRPYQGRYRCWRIDSITAAGRIADGTLDFVYIDGNHQYVAVCADLEAWWPKLRAGGILAGHDVVCPNEPEGGWGKTVQPAVFDFAGRHHLTVYLVTEPGAPWSFHLSKAREG